MATPTPALPARPASHRSWRVLLGLFGWVAAAAVGVGWSGELDAREVTLLTSTHGRDSVVRERPDHPALDRYAAQAYPQRVWDEVAWPDTIRPTGASCVLEVWMSGGVVHRVQVSSCDERYAVPLADHVMETDEYRLGRDQYALTVALVPPSHSWWFHRRAAAAVAAFVAPLLGWAGRRWLHQRSHAMRGRPADIVRDRAATMSQRVAAIRALAAPGPDGDGLLGVALEVRAVPELAAALVDGIRLHPTEGRLRWLAGEAGRRWPDWPDEVVDDAAWALVQGAPALGDDAEVELARALDTRDRAVAREAVSRLASLGTRESLPALRRARPTLGPTVDHAIEEISRRAQIGAGDLALADTSGGDVSFADPQARAGATSVAEGSHEERPGQPASRRGIGTAP